ncbi:hypothetical protein Afil01_66290 [Actinorhabdospora filicis]|uniref:Uncharacterized protein n=1 Tax=Actinorhabdospora filicis TaxID=1785913 RepID=A0A9W6ST29_9ACTN|nr:hypothetical protein [Actinorhabdospora filicis]GLZ81822.1 hypothetical protein Afil01_66290 [Actinorhabdospora filicis]
MAGIKFSADALRAYQKVVREQLDLVEDTMIAGVKNNLSVEPAFGKFPEANTALETYKGNFNKVWADLNRLKSALEAIDDACNTTLKNYDETETTNTAKS